MSIGHRRSAMTSIKGGNSISHVSGVLCEMWNGIVLEVFIDEEKAA